ncbi:MAG: hypothetical protein ATN32_08225 [Candidatus Epulonipiscium fishelsonii]|nr:MAG: hypothetical protein ATN32_08225 [Epulopiscium sp. AS2M-Bin002]
MIEIKKDRAIISLEEIKKDMAIISSNKLNIHQSKLIFMGILYELVQRKDLFPTISNLKSFINQVIVPRTEEKVELKNYLYKSRKQLAAQLSHIILNELEYNDILVIVEQLQNILPKNVPSKNVPSKNKSAKDTDISELTRQWMQFIGDHF